MTRIDRVRDLTADDVLWQVRRFARERYGTQRQYARERGVSPAYVSAILQGRKSMPDWMLDDLGLKRIERFVTINGEDQS
jgi:hypothetical protein